MSKVVASVATNMHLDQSDGRGIRMAADILEVAGSDLVLDYPPRRKNDDGWRRALVHDENDGLTINFNGDYPGGVTIVGLNNKLSASGPARVIYQNNFDAPELPKNGKTGDLVILVKSPPKKGGIEGLLPDEISLWVCTPRLQTELVGLGGVAHWSPIALGEQVLGTK